MSDPCFHEAMKVELADYILSLGYRKNKNLKEMGIEGTIKNSSTNKTSDRTFAFKSHLYGSRSLWDGNPIAVSAIRMLPTRQLLEAENFSTSSA